MPTCTGAVGFCHYKGHSIGLLLTWEGNKVVAVSCDYQACGYAARCELYKQRPVGFVQTVPSSRGSTNPDTFGS